jgi:hypothetical protein
MFLFLIFPRCFQICSIMGGGQIQYGKAVCADTRRMEPNHQPPLSRRRVPGLDSMSSPTPQSHPRCADLLAAANCRCSSCTAQRSPTTGMPLSIRGLEQLHATNGCMVCRDNADRRASVESRSTSPTTSGLCPFVVELYPTAIPLTMRNLEERHASGGCAICCAICADMRNLEERHASGGCAICADALERRAAADRLRAERQLDAQRRVQSEPERLSLVRDARSQAAAALCHLLLPAHQSGLAASNPNHNPANNA